MSCLVENGDKAVFELAMICQVVVRQRTVGGSVSRGGQHEAAPIQNGETQFFVKGIEAL